MSYYITPTEERQRELRRHWFLKNRHLYFFKAKPLKLLSKYERWKKIAKLLKLSKLACQRLEWITYYETKARRDAAFTARHFGISRKTFYKWFNRFQDGRNFPGLEDQDRVPKRKRQSPYRVVDRVQLQEAPSSPRLHLTYPICPKTLKSVTDVLILYNWLTFEFNYGKL